MLLVPRHGVQCTLINLDSRKQSGAFMELRIEVEEVASSLLTEENENEFINKQLASRMFDSLDGGDFERNMILSGMISMRGSSMEARARGMRPS